MTGTTLARTNGTALDDAGVSVPIWTEERIKVLRTTIAKDCTPAQFELALAVCMRTNLDPMTKQIHIVVRQGQLTMQIGIDGFRAIALRSGVYAGEEGPLYCGKDGVYTDTWLDDKPPVAAKFIVYRKDYARLFAAVVLFKEFASIGGPLWQKIPIHMLGNRAAGHAYRKAFQQELARQEQTVARMGVTLQSDGDAPEALLVDAEGEVLTMEARPIADPTGERPTQRQLREDLQGLRSGRDAYLQERTGTPSEPEEDGLDPSTFGYKSSAKSPVQEPSLPPADDEDAQHMAALWRDWEAKSKRARDLKIPHKALPRDADHNALMDALVVLEDAIRERQPAAGK